MNAQNVTQKPGRLTNTVKEAWLKAYIETGYITEACKITGIERRTVYRHLDSDREFQLAKNAADEAINAGIDDEILRRGRDGWDEPIYQGGKLVGQKRVYDPRLLLAAAKARMPERYADRYQVESKGVMLNLHIEGVERGPQ